MVAFADLWNNYPSDNTPCRDKAGQVPAGYDNQCAIRVGTALEKSGVLFTTFRGLRCPAAPKNSGMVAGAQALANWLTKGRFTGCPAPEQYTGQTAFDKIEDRTGIIFLANYWQRTTDTGTSRTTTLISGTDRE